MELYKNDIVRIVFDENRLHNNFVLIEQTYNHLCKQL
jgi:hypothetical protein